VTGKVGAIILAAGSGHRIGTPKYRLPLGDSTFLRTIVAQAARLGLSPIVCVVASAERDLIAAQTGDSVRLVVNEKPGRGMLSSVIEGLQHMGDSSGALVMPVDHPYVSDTTVSALISRIGVHPDHVIKPVFKSRGGHPVLIPAAAFQIVLEADPTSSLREVIARSGIQVEPLAVEDEGVLRNINLPGDLQNVE